MRQHAPPEVTTVTMAERDLVLFHGAFALLAIAVVAGLPGADGWRFVLLVVAYDVGLVLLSWARGHRRWLRLWWFGAVVSLWQVFPDWFLAAFGVLVFPRDGVPDIGPVTATMAGLWTIPVVIIVASAIAVEERSGRTSGAMTAALVGAVVFVSAEAVLPQLGVWRPRNVATIGSVAVYILPAEILFSVAAYDLFQQSRHRPPVTDIASGLLLMLLYLGTAAFGYLLIEWVPR